MPKPPRLAIDRNATKLHLFGRRQADRFDDAALEVIGELPNLEEVWLFGQLITRIPPSLAKLQRPFALHLGGNAQLASLDGIEALVRLRELALFETGTIDLARAFERLAEVPELVSLELMPKVPLPKSIAKLHSVIEIELNMKHAPSLDGALKPLAPLATLRSLAIDKHEGQLPPSIGELATLERLSLRGSKVTALPKTIGKLRALRTLDAHFNKLKALPDELFDCTALEVLDLCYNPIKQLSPNIGKLTALASLDLALTHVTKFPAELGALKQLRSLRVATKVKQLPEQVFALQLDDFDGPPALANRFTLRDVETPDDDEVVLSDATRLPDDFGQPTKLALRLQDLARPLPQLAKLTRLRELQLDYLDPALALPHVGNPAALERLSIRGEGNGPIDVARFTSLVRLGVDWLPPSLDVALPALEILWVRAKGKRVELATPKLRELTLIHTAAPDYTVLAALPLAKVELRGVNRLDAKRLFRALAGKPLQLLDLMWCELAALPAEVAQLAVRELDLRDTTLAKLPAELAQLASLRAITVSKPCALAKEQLPPGRWKKTERRSELRFDRTD